MSNQVLILDDSNSARLDLKTKLNTVNSPQYLYEASNYEEAAQIMHENPIDTVFVDLSMPKKNGMDFIVDFVRENKAFREVPIIVTTGVDKNSVLLKALNGLVHAVLTKPIKIDQLENAIAHIEHSTTN